MDRPEPPTTLPELLVAIEKSGNLRALARECGLTVRELRCRLANWRRELTTPQKAGPRVASGGVAPSVRERVAGLPRAATLRASPLPAGLPPALEIWTDGASRGNPGPASIGILFGVPGGPDLCVHGEAIGRATNNVAEYRAVLRALEFAREWGARRVDLYLDSELIARQLAGVYRVKSLDLRPLHQQVIALARSFADFRARHVPRESNGVADLLANEALDARPG